LGDLFSVILTLVGIIVILVLAYFASKWYAGRMGGTAMAKHIKVIDRLFIGKNASILIIELAGVQYLIGVTEQGVSILKELDEPIIPEAGGHGTGFNLRRIDFRDILTGYGKRKGGGL
jgi:flagellar biogenesis protein FliO